jgi:DNA-binding MarR family transcriptional regulator
VSGAGPSPEAEAARLRIAVLRLARSLTRPGTAELTPTQLSALFTVDAFFTPLRLKELAAIEGIAAPTLTRLIDELAGRGLVRRTRDVEDGRSARVAITDDGHALLDDLRRTGTFLLWEKLEELTATERQTVLAALPVMERLAAPTHVSHSRGSVVGTR